MIKSKSLHSIEIENCQFQTGLDYNSNTNHITIYIKHRYRDPEKMKKYREDNKDKIKQYREDNKNKKKEYQKEYYENNKEKQKEYYEKYRKNNKEYIIKINKEYRQDNRDPNTPKFGSEEWKIAISCTHRGISIEDFDGFSKEKLYCPKFNNKCRESNREKYNRRCFICDKSEIKNDRKLSVHHVDMSKSQGCNGEQWKLVPLCKSCHARCHNDLWKSRLSYLLNNPLL